MHTENSPQTKSPPQSGAVGVLDYAPALTARFKLRDLGIAIGWAVYLAMSWTWCIGMYLPVLLVRDFGIWGFVAFAIPNVLGAAAMGWVLYRPDSSALITTAHRPAMIWFSIATVVFQFYFAAWMFHREPMSLLLLATVVLAATGLVKAASQQQTARWELAAAAVVLLVSLYCALWTWAFLGFGWAAQFSSAHNNELFLLCPVIAFGFLLCPYLDLTFHRARQGMHAEQSRISFSIGFGVFFLVMICFTLVYLGHYPFASGWERDGLARWSLGVYFAVQLAFTVGVHLRQVTSQAREHWIGGAILLIGGACAGVLIYGASQTLEARVTVLPSHHFAEMTYRAFMGFYGLVFPAYVWLCLIPSPRLRPSRRSLIVFAIAVLVAAPMFWMGFIEGRMLWLLPGLSIVLLARLLVPRRQTDYAGPASGDARPQPGTH